jgi:hypothetical protein
MYWEVMNMTIFPGQYVHLRLGAWNTEQDYLDEVQPVLTESFELSGVNYPDITTSIKTIAKKSLKVLSDGGNEEWIGNTEV